LLLVVALGVVVAMLVQDALSGDRSTLKPVSLLDVSVQLRLIWELPAAEASKPLGADGTSGNVVPLALVTVTRALRERFDRHVRIARLTLPIWFYVSVTGVVIYLMLYGAGRPAPLR